MPDSLGIVIIGTNNGKYLEKALDSLQGEPAVYVCHSKSDCDLKLKSRAITPIFLDSAKTLNPSEARNQGYFQLKKQLPNIEFIQFLNENCTLSANWLNHAYMTLRDNPTVALVYGHLNETALQNPFHHQLRQVEKEAFIKKQTAFPEVFMIRASSFEEIGGFDPMLQIGEKQDLAAKLLKNEEQIQKIDQEMAFCNTGTFSLREWIKRSIHSGSLICRQSNVLGSPVAKMYLREKFRIFFLGGLFPAVFLISFFFSLKWSSLLFFLYILLFIKIYLDKNKLMKKNPKEAFLFSIFLLLRKIPQFFGCIKFYISRIGFLTKRNLDR